MVGYGQHPLCDCEAAISLKGVQTGVVDVPPIFI